MRGRDEFILQRSRQRLAQVLLGETTPGNLPSQFHKAKENLRCVQGALMDLDAECAASLTRIHAKAKEAEAGEYL